MVSSTAGDLKIHRPLAYKERANGKRTLVEARFVQRKDREIQLALGSYDRRRQLIIDLSVSYATYLGGTALDEGLGVATDGGGNTYITGGTNSPNFPNTGGGVTYQAAWTFLSRLSIPAGNLSIPLSPVAVETMLARVLR